MADMILVMNSGSSSIKFSVYAVDTGRICVAALNSRNVDYAADAIARVLKA